MSNWKSPAAARFLTPAVLGLALDQFVKFWADANLKTRSIDVIPGWLRLEWTPNHGAALGFFQGYRWMFLIVSVAAIFFLGGLFTTSRRNQRGYQIILGLLLAGVLGNMWDRIYLGYVRDMIHILPGRRWPPSIAAHLPAWWSTPELFPWIFNVADSLLCIGVALMLLHSLFSGSSKTTPAAEPQARQT